MRLLVKRVPDTQSPIGSLSALPSVSGSSLVGVIPPQPGNHFASPQNSSLGGQVVVPMSGLGIAGSQMTVPTNSLAYNNSNLHMRHVGGGGGVSGGEGGVPGSGGIPSFG